jgi:PKD repeat protein
MVRNMRKENRNSVPALISVLIMVLAAIVAAPSIGAIGGRAPGDARIQGNVVDNATNSMLNGVSVLLSDGVSYTNTTSTMGGGNYEIYAAAGAYTLNFTMAGYHWMLVPVSVIADEVKMMNIRLDQLPATVGGIVNDSNTDLPLEGVSVMLSHQGTPSGNANTVTDASGAYTLNTIAGNVQVTFSKQGYNQQMFMTMVNMNGNIVRDIELVPMGSTISGTVKSGGNALKGVDVVLISKTQQWQTETNETGVFAFNLLSYGDSFMLGVLASGHYGYGSSFQLNLGDDWNQDISLTPITGATSTVWGYVFDDNGQPVQDARMMFQEKGETSWAGALTGAGGYYSIALAAGFYDVKVEAFGYLSNSTTVDVLDSASKQADFVIRPVPAAGSTVSGVVAELGTGTPIVGATVTLVDASGARNSVMSGTAGAYSIITYNGDFTLEVSATGYFIYEAALTVSASATKDAEMIPVPAKGITLWGYVREADNTPIGMSRVILYDLQANHTGYIMEATTSSGGYYTISTYAGSFLLIAHAAGYTSSIVSQSVTVTVRKDITLDAVPATDATETYTFSEWGSLTYSATVLSLNTESNTRLDIDRNFGNGDGTVTQDEADGYIATLLTRGPMRRDSKSFLTIDGLYYMYVEGTFAVKADNAVGDVTNTSRITLVYSCNMTTNATVADAKVHSVKFNATYDTAGMTSKSTLALPPAYEMRKAESGAAVAIKGTSTVTVDPMVGLPGATGAYEWVTLTVNKNEPPIADTNGNQTVKPGTLLVFDASSSSDDKEITNYTWEFGDGTFGYGVTVNHTYADANTTPKAIYKVNLTITDSGGLTNVTNLTITMDGQAPVAIFSPGVNVEVIEQTGLLEVNASLSTDNVGIARYVWDWGDGRSGEGVATNHTYYDLPGKYNVTLNVTDKAGNFNTKMIVVTVQDNTTPVARFITNVTTAPAKVLVEFNGSTSSDNVVVTKWVWDFGDSSGKVEGNITQASVVNHSYATNGTYTVILNVTDGKFWNETSQVLVITEPLIFADLKAAAPTFNNDKPAENDKVTISVKITNNGLKDAKDFTVRFQDGTKRIADKKVTLLAVGQSKTVTAEWTVSKKGDHTVKVVLDVLSVIPESNETNNEVTAKITIQESKTTLYIGITAVVVVLVIIGAVLYSRRKESADEDEDEEEEEEEDEEEEEEEGDEEIEDEEAEESECPKCYAEVKPTDKKCASCGANLRR